MMSQRKSRVFRVTGLPRELPDRDPQTALQEVLNDNFTDNEKSQIQTKITIVPSCYEGDTQRVALVQFDGGVPQFLSALIADPLGDWQVEMGDSDINFDCHFHGFTQLYTPHTPDEEGPDADIIAIAGLDGHAYGSWQGGNLSRMWLRDFLSTDLPQCRTMTYGYNSKLSSHGAATILDYGRELMEEIKKIRNTKELQQRPLIFIAHSFGGIIMAHCLVRASRAMDEDHPAITSFYRATYGMILFGIPHKGLVMNDIRQMLGTDRQHPREPLLRQISRESDLLANQLADFKNLIRDRKVVSFYETEQTRQLVFDSENGRWRRTGEYITTVDADSALLQLPDHVEVKVPLHADHSMMVKFDSRNKAGYRTACNSLQQFVKDAPSVVAARFSEISIAANYFARERRVDILSWLSGVPYNETYSRISQAIVKGTGTWIFSRDTYWQWKTEMKSSVFWLRGPPGYGKTAIASVLIGQIAEETKNDCAQALHFFYCSGDNEHRISPSSIMTTLLHQILAHLPVGHNSIEEQCEKWMLKGLTRDSVPLVEATMLYETSTAQFHRVYIVVDALDEITQDNRQQFLKVANHLITKPGTCYYKIFITSRNKGDIGHFLGSELNLEIQPADNADDIREVIWTKIEDCVQKKTLLRGKVDSETKYYLREVLSQRAQGLFLWVQLQFDELHHATTRKELIHLIEVSYVNLEQTYQKLWARIDAQRHSKRILALALLEFLTISEQPITFECLKQIIGQKTRSEGLYPDDMDEYMFLDVCHNMVLYDWELKTFHLIHITAREFLMNHLNGPQAHTWIAKACLQELLNATSLIEIPGFGGNGTATTGKPIKFMFYAALHWHHHSRNCIRTSEYNEVEQAFLQHDRAPRVWTKILKSATRDHGQNIKTLLCFQQAFPSTTDSLFLAACFFGLKDIFAVLHMDIKTTTRGYNRFPPTLEEVRRFISWNSHFLDSSKFCVAEITVIDQILRNPYAAGAICAAEQGHEIIFKELWQDLSVAKSVSENNLRDFTRYCCQLLATAYKHINILDYIDLEPSPIRCSGPDASPFAFLRGSLVGVSAFLGHSDMVQYWERKLSTNPNYDPNTDLMHAIFRDDDSAVTLLLDHTKVAINLETSFSNALGNFTDTPLRLAATRGYHKLIKILLQYPGIDVNWQDSYGQTALMDIADSGPAVEALCRHKNINVNLRNSLGLTALEIFIRDSHTDALAELIKHQDINVNRRNNWNEVPLMTAVRLRRVEVVRVLLQATSIDVNACDESGSNALDIARRLDHEPLIRLLSQRKGNITDNSQELIEDMSTALLQHRITWEGRQTFS